MRLRPVRECDVRLAIPLTGRGFALHADANVADFAGRGVPEFDLSIDPGVWSHGRMPDVPHLVNDPCDQMNAALPGDDLYRSLLRHGQKVARQQDDMSLDRRPAGWPAPAGDRGNA